MKLFAQWIVKRAAWISFVSAIFAFFGAYYSVQLYKNLRTDIEELLPTTARSIIDLNEVTGRLEAFETLVVLAFSDDKVRSKQFVNDLALHLNKIDKDLVASVEYKIDKEMAFFNARRSLFVDLDDLLAIEKFIGARIEYEKELHNPLNIFSGAEFPEPVLDYLAMQKKYSAQTSTFANLPGGYYATKDEKVRLLVVYMKGKGLEKALKMQKAIQQAVADTDPSKYGVEIKYTGNVQNMIEESAALVADLELSTVIVVLMVMGIMLLFFKTFWATFLLLCSLFWGTFWTFGLAYFLVGYLNANTAFLASIVIGNGINFGVIYLARYMEERRAGHNHLEATEKSIVATATSTWTAALAAGLSYGSLMLTSFRGFNQFGVIGLTGMLLCWTSAYVLFPAFLTMADRWFGNRWVTLKAPNQWISGWIATMVDRYPARIWYVAVGGIVASLLVFPMARHGVLETDMTKLRDKACLEHGSGSLYHYIDDVFGHSVSPMVILPRKREDATKIAALLRDEKKKQGTETYLSTIQTLDDFIPSHQQEKIRVLRRIATILPPRLMSRLAPADRKLVGELLSPESLKPMVQADLPPMVISKFRERDGSIGKIVLLDKVIDTEKDDVTLLAKFVHLGRDMADKVALGTPVAGSLPISYDLLEAIQNDGPKATLFAFLAVIILVVILFRETQTILRVLFGLMLGVTWLAGLLIGLKFKINFLNFIALPITFGIGVDYGVNVFQRYREVGGGHIADVIRHTGGAVMLASMTTIIGYGSLLIAGNQAFVSFGWVAVMGELTCVGAAVIGLPAFLQMRDVKRRRKEAAAAATAAPTET